MKPAKEKGGQRSVFAQRRAESCPAGFSTGLMLRQRLRISTQQFKSLVSSHVIVASRYNEANYPLYSEEVLQMLLNRQADGSLFKYAQDSQPLNYTAEDTVKVYELLDKQVPIHHIVMQTRLLPQTVNAIQREYDAHVASVTIPKAILDQMNLLRARLTGPFPLRSATDILTVMAMAAEDRTCSQCNAVSCAELCMSCMRSRLTPPQPQQPQPQLEGHANGSNGNGAHAHHAPPTLPTGERT